MRRTFYLLKPLRYIIPDELDLRTSEFYMVAAADNVGKFTPDHLKLMKEGIELFNEKKYWECHEALEDIWLESVGDNARFIYWAVIQIAASMYHVRDGNLAGARGLLTKSKDKIQKAEASKIETDTLNKNLEWIKVKEMVHSVPESASLDAYQELYDFKFKDPSEWEL